MKFDMSKSWNYRMLLCILSLSVSHVVPESSRNIRLPMIGVLKLWWSPKWWYLCIRTYISLNDNNSISYHNILKFRIRNNTAMLHIWILPIKDFKYVLWALFPEFCPKYSMADVKWATSLKVVREKRIMQIRFRLCYPTRHINKSSIKPSKTEWIIKNITVPYPKIRKIKCIMLSYFFHK